MLSAIEVENVVDGLIILYHVDGEINGLKDYEEQVHLSAQEQRFRR